MGNLCSQKLSKVDDEGKFSELVTINADTDEDNQTPDEQISGTDSQENKTKDTDQTTLSILGDTNSIKIMLVGRSKSGKTCLKNVLTGKFFEDEYCQTIGFDCVTIGHKVGENINDVQIWDLSGDIRCIDIFADHLKYFTCVCFIYDGDVGSNFNEVLPFEKKVDKYAKNIIKIFVRNKKYTPFKKTDDMLNCYDMDLRNTDDAIDLIDEIVKLSNK